MNYQALSIVLGTCLSVVSIILAIRFNKIRKLTWSFITEKVIGLESSAPEGLQLLFNGKVIEDVYRTTLILFNKGRETIRKSDITEPIIAHFSNSEILTDPMVRKVSNQAITLSATKKVEESEHQLVLDFLYLDHEDGGIIEVIHTKSDDIGFTGNGVNP